MGRDKTGQAKENPTRNNIKIQGNSKK